MTRNYLGKLILALAAIISTSLGCLATEDEYQAALAAERLQEKEASVQEVGAAHGISKRMTFLAW